jgi:hypothetical protein
MTETDPVPGHSCYSSGRRVGSSCTTLPPHAQQRRRNRLFWLVVQPRVLGRVAISQMGVALLVSDPFSNIHLVRKGEKDMRALRSRALLILMSFSVITLAQTIMPLPKTLSGRWTAVVPGVGTFSDTISVVLDVPAQPGPLTGRLTSRGVTCGAMDEPLVGNWDGTELRFESKVQANVNVQRLNGQCASGRITYVLTRKPGQAAFEGEARRDGMSSPAQVTLAP